MRMLGLVAVAAGLLAPCVASAQTRYYMRERIVGMPTASQTAPQDSAYPGRWSSSTSSGACVSGSRTTSVVGSCSGGACDPALDPTRTTTAACTVKVTCDSLTPGFLNGSFEPYVEISASSHALLRTKATDLCAQNASATGCRLAGQGTSFTSGILYVRNAPGGAVTTPTSYDTTYFYSSVCRSN